MARSGTFVRPSEMRQHSPRIADDLSASKLFSVKLLRPSASFGLPRAGPDYTQSENTL